MIGTSLLGVYCILIVAASLLGGWLPTAARLTHTQLQWVTSLVAGLMLGVGTFHLLPHGHVLLSRAGGTLDLAMLWLVAGILCMFLLLRAFHFHAHEGPRADAFPAETVSPISAGKEPLESHGQLHAGQAAGALRGWSWLGVALGLSLHTLLDGVALAASVLAESVVEHDTTFPVGMGTFLAVFLHKPLDALSITVVMSGMGWSPGWRNAVNAGFALVCPLGAFAFYFGSGALLEREAVAVGSALAFSAGVFICIALSDLLPEIEFHSHDRVKLTAALLIGIALAYAIVFLEPRHAHREHHSAATRAMVPRQTDGLLP